MSFRSLHSRSSLSLSGLAVSLFGCTTDPSAVSLDAQTTPVDARDVSTDTVTTDTVTTDTDARCRAVPDFETGSDTGNLSPLQLPLGASRAGRLNTKDLPADRTGLGEWRAGDFVLVNHRVGVIIETARPSSGYDPWGGMPIGAARFDNGRLVDAADFSEVITGLGRFTFRTRSVTVLHDGTDTPDGTAVVRAVGNLTAIPFIDEFASAVAPGDYSDLDAAIDYSLGPDADHVDVNVTFAVSTPGTYTIPKVLHAFFQGNRMPRFIPDRGFVRSPGLPRTIAWIDPVNLSWAWRLPDSNHTFRPFISISGFDAFTSPPLSLPGCAHTRVAWAQLFVGTGPGLDGLQRSLARADNVTLRTLTGTVTDTHSNPLPNVNVHVTSPDGDTYYNRVSTDASGRFTASAPAGPVRLTPYAPGYPTGAPVILDANANTTTLTLGPVATLRVVITENGSPAPARVQVFAVSPTVLPTVPEAFGEPTPGEGRLHAVFPTNGEVILPVFPGRWRVVVSRGWAYEITDRTLELTSGEQETITADFSRVVPRDGVLCGDFHIHTHRSVDSSDDARFKLSSGVGEGLDIMARSDHEYVSDFQPLIDSMGLTPWVRGVASIELTTFTYGHFGVFPLVPDPTRPNNGNFSWARRLPTEVFADVRARPENPTLVINHPRGGTNGAYFDAARYNSATRTAGRPEYWDTHFTAVEFFNDSSFEENPQQVSDWFSFLTAGRHIAAVGSSDSHHLDNSPVGYPRTCLSLGSDQPSTVSPDAIARAVGAGRGFISGGAWLSVSANTTATPTITAHPGEELTHTGPTVQFNVTVYAPSWVRLRKLQLFSDGTQLTSITLTDSLRDPTQPVVRYRGSHSVPVAPSGSWVIAVVSGDELSPVYSRRRAFAVSNPIYLRR